MNKTLLVVAAALAIAASGAIAPTYTPREELTTAQPPPSIDFKGQNSLLGIAIHEGCPDPNDASGMCARQKERCALPPEKRGYDESGLCD